jgi:NagD protein
MIGLDIPDTQIFTSAIATARFLKAQRPGGTAYVIGDSGLTSAIHDIGYIITEHNPAYVVLGETMSYNFDMLTKATRLVAGGAHFIATNPDPSGPTAEGMVPSCGAVAALIQRATSKNPFFVGKPNPLIDRMDTDVVSGVQSGMDTILVLSGITLKDEIGRYPYVPTRIVDSVADIEV